jgi:hypothetical protein
LPPHEDNRRAAFDLANLRQKIDKSAGSGRPHELPHARRSSYLDFAHDLPRPQPTIRRRPQRFDRALDPRPYELPLVICPVEHQILKASRFKLGVGTVLSDQQVGGAPDVGRRYGPGSGLCARIFPVAPGVAGQDRHASENMATPGGSWASGIVDGAAPANVGAAIRKKRRQRQTSNEKMRAFPKKYSPNQGHTSWRIQLRSWKGG